MYSLVIDHQCEVISIDRSDFPCIHSSVPTLLSCPLMLHEDGSAWRRQLRLISIAVRLQAKLHLLEANSKTHGFPFNVQQRLGFKL